MQGLADRNIVNKIAEDQETEFLKNGLPGRHRPRISSRSSTATPDAAGVEGNGNVSLRLFI